MYIHNYQIHNVLNVYQRQLTQGLANNKQRSTETSQDNSQIAYKRNRQNIIEKVSSNILNKINLLDSNTQSINEFDKVMQHEIQKEKSIDHKKSDKFSFNVINQNNQKISSSIAVDNSEELIYRLDKITQNGNQNKEDTKIDIKV
jgi:hypothetical protein